MSAQAPAIREQMEIVGNDGGHVGTVDSVEGDQIRLVKGDDPSGTGRDHHFLPLKAVEAVSGDKVRLTMSAARARNTSTLVAGDAAGTPHRRH